MKKFSGICFTDINMQQSMSPGLPLNQPFTPGIYAVWGEEKI